MRTRTLRVVAVAAGIGLLAAACGDDSDTDAGGGPGDTPTDTTSAITVTIGADSIEVPAEAAAGAVEVTIEGETTEETEVDFSRVEPGTTEDDFTTGLLAVFQGEPFPEFFLANAGAGTDPSPNTILLEPGEYFVWTEAGSDEGEGDGTEGEGDGTEGEEGGEGEGGPPELLVTSMTVTGEAGGELPETDGTITAEDYAFDIDVAAGDTYTFRNSGPVQLHHAVLFNFGALDEATVEANIAEFLQGDDDAPPPEAFADLDFESLEAGGSAVFSAGLGGVFAAPLEAGNTYAVACFISDRSGGPPHAIANDMFEVFAVS